MMVLTFLGFLRNSCLQEEYENKIDNFNAHYDLILIKAREDMLFGDSDIFYALDICLKIACSNFNITVKDKLHEKVLEKFNETMKLILCTILDLRLDKHLIRLILTTRINLNKALSNYSIIAAHTTLLLKKFMVVSSSERKINDNFDLWNDYMQKTISEDNFTYFNTNNYENGIQIKNQNILKKNIWVYLFTDHIFSIVEKHDNVLKDQIDIFDLNGFFYQEQTLDVPFFRTNYYRFINEVMESFETVNGDDFYFLFSHKGFRYNRISNSTIIDLYKRNCYKSFTNFDDFYETDLDVSDIDLSYLEGKEFMLYTKIIFEYVMGLLQYISCSHKKHIICLLKKKSYVLKIIYVSGPPIELILDYFKCKNDLTKEIQENYDRYVNRYFTTILEEKEYRFTRQDKDVTVPSKCLLLSCSHILGNELLTEYFLNLSERCYFCNIESTITGYFEVDLFTSELK